MNHAQLRALERYGIKLGLADLRQIAKDIVMGNAVLLGRDFHGAERWLVKVREKGIKLVYNPENGKVISILPARGPRPRHFYARKVLKGRGK